MSYKEIVRVLTVFRHTDCGLRLLLDDTTICSDFIEKCQTCKISHTAVVKKSLRIFK